MPSPEDTAAALARNLRRLRGERGLTLDGFARRAGVSRSMLIQIEQQRVNPTLATLVRLAQALDVGLAELVELGSRHRVRVISRDDIAELWTSPGGGSGRLLVGSDQLDHIVLFSGDGDFRSLVAAVQAKGRRVTVISTLTTRPPMIADDLRRQTDQFIDLNDLKDEIGRDPSERRERPAPPPQSPRESFEDFADI